MANEFANVFAQFQSFQAPVAKANKLAVANFEKLVGFQFNAFRSYVDLSVEQLKAASEVNDSKSLQDFLAGRAEVANVVRQKVLDDAKALADLNAGFLAEFSKLAEENVAEVSDKVAKLNPVKAA